MTLIERLLAQASKESNELADLLEEAAEALAQPQQEPVNQRAHETALRQWESWKAYALELQDKLVKYEGGTLMVLNTAPQPAQQEPVTDEEPIGTYESVTDIMLQLRNGTIGDQQVYEVMKDKPLYTSPPKKEWSGLTDEEIDALLLPEYAGDSEMHDFARDIQSKLKGKNS